MDKRDFLKISGAVLTSNVLARFVSAEQQTGDRPNTPLTNWAGNYTFRAKHLYQPATIEEVQDTVKSCTKLRALGARHSFNSIADSAENQLSLKKLDSISVDAAARTVTVGAGVTYGQLAPVIDAHGFALHNLASLPHISVVGACATATHGSGSNNGNLTTAISAMQVVSPDGSLHTISRSQTPEIFPGAAVHLGSLGVLTSITLDLQPTFQVAQSVYQNLSFDQLEHNLDAIFASGYSVSLFTDWQQHRATQVWIKTRLDKGAPHTYPTEFYGAKVSPVDLHPINGHSAESCTEQRGIAGPWYERLPHFRMNFTPSSGAELQTEYFVPRDRGYEAILAVEQLRNRITPHLFVTELRTIAADNLWMSPCYQRPSLAIHFTWKPEWPEVRQILPLIEAKLEPFNARPHWAKLNTISPTRLATLYPKLADFRSLLIQHDPQGKFRNEYIDTEIFSS
jgi:xylitol oxidase